MTKTIGKDNVRSSAKLRSGAEIFVYNGVAVLVGLLISTGLLTFMKINPFDVVSRTLVKIFTDKYNIGEIFVKATPLIFTSLAFAFTYKANLFNIGAQGQFYAGSMAAISISLALGGRVPKFILIPLVLIMSCLAGALVGGLIGLAKAKRNANEFLVSMISTYVVNALMDYLLRTGLQETKAEYMQTDAIVSESYLSIIVKGTRVHSGFIIAVVVAIVVWIILEKTTLGFRIRAVGLNRHAAALGGINTKTIFIISFLIAGGLAGMAGVTEINGVQHMLLRNFNASIGSFGIGIAILANSNPIGCIFASILFGFLNVVGTTMGRLPGTSIPASLVELIEGIVMVCVIIATALRVYVGNAREKRAMKKGGAK